MIAIYPKKFIKNFYAKDLGKATFTPLHLSKNILNLI